MPFCQARRSSTCPTWGAPSRSRFAIAVRRSARSVCCNRCVSAAPRWDNPHDEQAADAHLQWARGVQALSPHPKGFYVNTLAAQGPSPRVRATYGDNYERLLALKRQYDPSNVFHRNVNIAGVGFLPNSGWRTAASFGRCGALGGMRSS